MVDGPDGTAGAPGRDRRPRPAPRRPTARRADGRLGLAARPARPGGTGRPPVGAKSKPATRRRPVPTPSRPRTATPSRTLGTGRGRPARREPAARRPSAAIRPRLDGRGLVGCGRELVDVLNGIWNQILEITSLFVMPDWGGLIGLLPVLIFVGLVGAVHDLPGARHDDLPRRASRAIKVGLRGRAAGRRDRRRRRAGLPGRAPLLPARRAGLPVRHAPLRAPATTSSR